MIDPFAAIHSQACVTPDVSIGPHTSVWQFASVIRGAVIGEDCNVGSCAIIDGAVVGSRVLVGASAQLHPGTRIADDVFIGPGVVFCNDMWPRVAKDYFSLDRLVRGGLVSILVEPGASVGAGAIVLPGVVIGAGAMVAAGVVVDRSVPAGLLFMRNGKTRELDADEMIHRMRAAQCCD